jgi:hypothetical protein
LTVSSPSPFQLGNRKVVKVTFNVLGNAPVGNGFVNFTDSPVTRLMTNDAVAVFPAYTNGFVNVVTPRSIIINSTFGNVAPAKSTFTIDMVALGGERGASFTLVFDPTKFSVSGNDPSAGQTNNDISLGGGLTAAGCATFTTNATQLAQGRLGLGFNCPNNIAAGKGRLFNITLTNIGAAAGTVNHIAFSGNPTNRGVNDANGDLPLPSYVEGDITILGPTAAGVSVSGRVVDANGQGLRNASVVITDSEGNRRNVTTSSFGYYQFDDVSAGGTYVISVSAKKYRFGSRIIQVSDSLADVNFTGVE